MIGLWALQGLELLKWLVDQASDVPAITFFFIISCKILCKNSINLFFYFLYKFTKMKIKSFECPKYIWNYKKRKMLGKLDAWSTSHLSQPTSKAAYYIVDFKSSSLALTLGWLMLICINNQYSESDIRVSKHGPDWMVNLLTYS